MVEGTQIGAYRILRQIGSGGMGEVWLAEHAMLGRRAAIKVLHAEFSSRTDIVTRFFNEARAATAISDPGIVQIFDFGHHVDGSAYIVMELLDGEPLDKRLHRLGALPLIDALRTMRQIASSLGAAHARGIVHRDLKPENIFLVRDAEVNSGERAKILDFGIAKLTGEGHAKTQTSAVMGTPTYMSPEQCRGAGHVDMRSDVYALGCMLFTLLVGRPPFDAEGIGEIIAMHLREPAPLASSMARNVPPDVDALIACCMQKDPNHRFASGTDLATAIGQVMTHSGLGTAPIISNTSPGMQHGMQTPAPPTPTTLSAMAMQVPAKGNGKWIAAAAAIVVIGAGVGIVAVQKSKSSSANAGDSSLAVNTPAPAPAPAPTTPPVAVAQPKPVPVAPPPPVTPPAPAKPDNNAITATRMARVLTGFVVWSKAHATDPCPTGKQLAAALSDDHAIDDAWGHAMTVTCTDQPGDQIIGVVSAGVDGVAGNADDVASWDLGHDTTELVHGARWAPIVAKTHTHGPHTTVATTPPTGPGPGAKKPPATGTTPPPVTGDGIPDSR